MTGAALGLEFAPAPGVYFILYLLFAEITLYNEEELEDE
jgi:hypothetical protein